MIGWAMRAKHSTGYWAEVGRKRDGGRVTVGNSDRKLGAAIVDLECALELRRALSRLIRELREVPKR